MEKCTQNVIVFDENNKWIFLINKSCLGEENLPLVTSFWLKS